METQQPQPQPLHPDPPQALGTAALEPPLLESPALEPPLLESPAPAPEPPASSAADEALLYGMLIRQIRRRTKLTQIAFTRRYGIPLGTYRDWEQGRARPDATARSYLALIAKAPEEIAALIGD